VKAIIGAAIAILAVAAPAMGGASPASGCSATSGVTVIVDFTHFPGGKVERGCAPGQPADGLVALHNAGFTSAGTAQYGDAFVCRINGLPTPKQDACAVTPLPTAYWSFWSARPADTGWTYSSVGVLDFHPKAGSIEAFAFGSRAQPSVSPSEAVPPVTTSTTTKRPPPTAPRTNPPPPVTAGSTPVAPGTTGVPLGGPGSATTTTTPRSAPNAKPKVKPKPSRTSSTTAPRSTTTSSGVPIVDRTASSPTPHDASGSPLGAILAVVIVGGLGIGAFAFTRARRRRPA
jgi:hypothetical protein